MAPRLRPSYGNDRELGTRIILPLWRCRPPRLGGPAPDHILFFGTSRVVEEYERAFEQTCAHDWKQAVAATTVGPWRPITDNKLERVRHARRQAIPVKVSVAPKGREVQVHGRNAERLEN